MVSTGGRPMVVLAIVAGVCAGTIGGGHVPASATAGTTPPAPALAPDLYPGARSLVGAPVPDGVEPRPLYVVAAGDNRANEGCSITTAPAGSADTLRCDFGPEDAPLRIAAIGSSHIGHWRAALNRVARRLDVRFTSYIRNGCLFSDPPDPLPGPRPCATWREATMAALAADPPDAVLLNSTDTINGRREWTSVGMVTVWRQLAALGIPVIGIRDTPRLSVHPPQCAAQYGPGSRRCRVATSDSLAPVAPVLDTDLTGIDYHHIDMTDWLCPRGTCRPVIGNVTVWRDYSHITDSYARTLAPILARQLAPILEEI